MTREIQCKRITCMLMASLWPLGPCACSCLHCSPRSKHWATLCSARWSAVQEEGYCIVSLEAFGIVPGAFWQCSGAFWGIPGEASGSVPVPGLFQEPTTKFEMLSNGAKQILRIAFNDTKPDTVCVSSCSMSSDMLQGQKIVFGKHKASLIS